jgi:DNA helicase-2/ATP-dependent DNA helicase PcrA
MLADDAAEARSIAEAITSYIGQGHSPSDIAVLYRINAQSLEIAEALVDAEIPIAMRGSDRFFEQPEIREAMTRLRGLARSDQVPSSVVEAVDGVLSAMNWTSISPTSVGAVRDRWETLAALRGLAVEMQQGMALSEFIEHLDQRAEAAHAPDAQAVTLASLHAAKGLEWPIVFIAGCSDGLIPLVHAESAEELAEERRLLYVGVTRAKDELHLSWAAAREPGGRAVRNVSRFLEGLGASPAPQREGSVRRGTAKRVRRGPAACRSCGKALVTAAERTIGRCRVCPATFADEDFDALRTWRLAKAQAAGVPAYVIFTDATAIAICEQHPSSLEELAGIPGIGPAKLAEYGDEILAQVRSWAAPR